MLLKYAEGEKLEPGYLDSAVMCEADKVGRIIQNAGGLSSRTCRDSSSAADGFAVLCVPLALTGCSPRPGISRKEFA